MCVYIVDMDVGVSLYAHVYECIFVPMGINRKMGIMCICMCTYVHNVHICVYVYIYMCVYMCILIITMCI